MKARHFREVLVERGPELFREIGVLWLVFSILDRVITNAVTPGWIASNVSLALVIWIFGIYLESRTRE
jgi:hypothetical protein